jgi:hypothetical protein
MPPATSQRRSPLGLFPEKAPPRLYDRIVEGRRVRHDSRRTKAAWERSRHTIWGAIAGAKPVARIPEERITMGKFTADRAAPEEVECLARSYR